MATFIEIDKTHLKSGLNVSEDSALKINLDSVHFVVVEKNTIELIYPAGEFDNNIRLIFKESGMGEFQKVRRILDDLTAK